jgi:putative redox protein
MTGKSMLEGVKSPHPVEVVWDGGRRFKGGPPGVPPVILDGDRQGGPSPVDNLLVSLASCAAIDVIDILEKRRTPAHSVSVRLEFSRAEKPPRRLTEVQAYFSIVTASERPHVVRALELSFEKYCSVTASLAPDTVLTWFLDLESPASDEAAG